MLLTTILLIPLTLRHFGRNDLSVHRYIDYRSRLFTGAFRSDTSSAGRHVRWMPIATALIVLCSLKVSCAWFGCHRGSTTTQCAYAFFHGKTISLEQTIMNECVSKIQDWYQLNVKRFNNKIVTYIHDKRNIISVVCASSSPLLFVVIDLVYHIYDRVRAILWQGK